MVISLRRILRPTIGILLISALLLILWMIFDGKKSHYLMGGYIHKDDYLKQEISQPVSKTKEVKEGNERFLRPSRQPALKLKYSYKDFESMLENPPGSLVIFSIPEDAIHAYYAILEDASNMEGYTGGCGTIGHAGTPYPYAYQLLSKNMRQQISLDEFIKSFAGTAHTTLLKLYPAYAPPDTPENIKYYMVEIEIITSPPYEEKDGDKPQPSYFAYYYGLITLERIHFEGWKIKEIDYIPEDFLCAPYHLWYWDASVVVQTIFGNWYKLIDEIEKVDVKGSQVQVIAKGKENRYKFDAVRLTSGIDLFMREYVEENGRWKEVDYIVERHKYLKFSVLKYEISQEKEQKRGK
jgi:hypothetical protein